MVFARLGVGVTVGVVPEFAERPGAKHITESWLGEVDDGVRVLLKTLSEGRFELFDLKVDLFENTNRCFGRRRERRHHRIRCGQLFRTKRSLDFLGSRIEVALTARPVSTPHESERR